MNENINAAAEYIRSAVNGKIDIAIVLGSGLGSNKGDSTRDMDVETRIPYSTIPGFAQTTVPGHAGELVVGKVCGLRVAAMRGRFHMYEGHDMASIVLPVRSLIRAGADIVMLTNAAGGINTSFKPGTLMLIDDHINMTGRNPLIGPNDDTLGSRFPDMTHAYDVGLLDIARKTARDLDIGMREGVYAWFTGPSYETPAEIRMLRTMGADAVGMSTVPEVIAAHHMGARVMGISCITNMAAGVIDKPLSHKEVGEVALRTANEFSRLIYGIIERIARERQHAVVSLR